MVGALLLVLSAVPTYAVAVTRQVGVDATRAQDIARELGKKLVEQSAVGALKSVDGQPASADDLRSWGTTVGLERVVVLQLVRVGSQVAIDAKVVEVASGQSLATATRVVELRDLEVDEALAGVAAELGRKVPAPAVVEEAPKPLVPVPVEEPPKPVEPAPAAVVDTYSLKATSVRLFLASGVTTVLGAALVGASRFETPPSDGTLSAGGVSFGIAAALAIAAVVTLLLAP